MRTIDSNTAAALTAARTAGVVERDLLYIFAHDRGTNAIVPYGFWSDLDSVTLNVISGQDGTTVSRTYSGDGAILSIGDIPNVSDLSIQNVPVSLSQLHAGVQTMFRTSDIRLASAEIHRVLLDPATRNLVAAPYCHFVGQVNIAPLTTPAVGAEGGIMLTLVSDTRELTRTNPAKRSDQTQTRRSGDRLMKYASVTANISIFWGEQAVGPNSGGNSAGSKKQFLK